MSLPESHDRSPTHDETAADAADAATLSDGSTRPFRFLRRLATWGFWWIAHHAVARPLAAALPFRGMFRFSAWTRARRNMLA